MFFILSKILIFLLKPLFWVFILLILATAAKNKKHKKRYFISAVVVLYLFSTPLSINQFAVRWDFHGRPPQTKTPYSCAIVLGGFASEGGKGNGYFNNASDRFIQATKLKHTGQVSNILVSSGSADLLPDGFKEADWVKGQLLLQNIPDSSILIENQSRNTIENALYSKKILEKSGLKPPYLLVTSGFHMRRSYYIFTKAGMNVIPYPCNFFAGSYQVAFRDFVPTAETLYDWDFYTKEIVGLAATHLKM